MPRLRIAAPTLLLAALLLGCDSASDEPEGLAKVLDTCESKTADSLKAFTDKLTADQFFDLSADGDTLRVVTPAPKSNVVTRSEALGAAQCVFRETGADPRLAEQLGVPATGEQRARWKGYAGTWESDDERGYRARVVAEH